MVAPTTSRNQRTSDETWTGAWGVVMGEGGRNHSRESPKKRSTTRGIQKRESEKY